MTDLVTRDFIAPAADGYPLSMRLVAAAEPWIAVLVSSGTGFPKGFYERFARYLAGRGAAVLTYDFRGIAGSRPDELKGSTIDYPDWGRLDMPAALDALIDAAPGLRLVHVGHSVGGISSASCPITTGSSGTPSSRSAPAGGAGTIAATIRWSCSSGWASARSP